MKIIPNYNYSKLQLPQIYNNMCVIISWLVRLHGRSSTGGRPAARDVRSRRSPGGPLQALVVLDYKLIIVMRTATVVFLGRRREALSSTTRNQSSSQLQKGANQNRGSPTLNRDEDPCWVWENPLQLAQELICTKAVFFLNQNHHIYYRIADPCWDWENPLQLPTFYQ